MKTWGEIFWEGLAVLTVAGLLYMFSVGAIRMAEHLSGVAN